MIIPAYFEDLQTHHLGTSPNRAYFIPASVRMDDLVENREHSDRFQLLNGNWKFKYCESIYDFEEFFYEEGFDASAWDTIPVPSVWQNHGYDRHQYTNIRFPFPADPPYVPYDNPCGAYLHTFTYKPNEAAPKVYLNFEGVDSCFYVWLNGQWVGYSEVSHSSSEFDVSECIREGENILAVMVLKWCAMPLFFTKSTFTRSLISCRASLSPVRMYPSVSSLSSHRRARVPKISSAS